MEAEKEAKEVGAATAEAAMAAMAAAAVAKAAAEQVSANLCLVRQVVVAGLSLPMAAVGASLSASLQANRLQAALLGEERETKCSGRGPSATLSYDHLSADCAL